MKTIDELLKQYEIKDPECGDCVNDGWVPMIEKLIQELIALGWDKNLQQIKEKFGGLRFYVGCATPEMYELISQAENDSFKTCSSCSQEAVCKPLTSTNFWLLTLCNSCRERISSERAETLNKTLKKIKSF